MPLLGRTDLETLFADIFLEHESPIVLPLESEEVVHLLHEDLQTFVACTGRPQAAPEV